MAGILVRGTPRTTAGREGALAGGRDEVVHFGCAHTELGAAHSQWPKITCVNALAVFGVYDFRHYRPSLTGTGGRERRVLPPAKEWATPVDCDLFPSSRSPWPRHARPGRRPRVPPWRSGRRAGSAHVRDPRWPR